MCIRDSFITGWSSQLPLELQWTLNPCHLISKVCFEITSNPASLFLNLEKQITPLWCVLLWVLCHVYMLAVVVQSAAGTTMSDSNVLYILLWDKPVLIDYVLLHVDICDILLLLVVLVRKVCLIFFFYAAVSAFSISLIPTWLGTHYLL